MSAGIDENLAMVCVLVFTAILGHVIAPILASLFSGVFALVIVSVWGGHLGKEVAWARLVT